ncbi:hypothetical protein B0H11DRAFT_2228157 [Mycena galericulata]|nr:hypothetical protein B0H11DRAFT_2228157 [Mycena galericulata]
MDELDKDALLEASHDYWDELEVNLSLGWPGSSPHSAVFRSEMLQRAESVLLQMRDVAQNSQEPGDKPPQGDALARRRRKAEKRLGEIMNKGAYPPIDSEEFLEMLKNPIHGERAELENAALVRLLRGYDGASGSTAWFKTFSLRLRQLPLSTKRSTLMKLATDYITQNASEPTNVQALTAGFGLSEAELLTRHILEHVSVAAFGLDWISITGENSNREKSTFYVSAYQDLEDHRDFFAALTPGERESQMQNDHKASYWEWRRRLEPQITARNRYVEMYQEFGPPIFLDPFWSVQNLTNNARTKEFPLLLSLLYQNIPRDPEDTDQTVTQSRHAGSKKALQGTIRCINRKLWHFLRDFLEENPDRIL